VDLGRNAGHAVIIEAPTSGNQFLQIGLGVPGAGIDPQAAHFLQATYRSMPSDQQDRALLAQTADIVPITDFDGVIGARDQVIRHRKQTWIDVGIDGFAFAGTQQPACDIEIAAAHLRFYAGKGKAILITGDLKARILPLDRAINIDTQARYMLAATFALLDEFGSGCQLRRRAQLDDCRDRNGRGVHGKADEPDRTGVRESLHSVPSSTLRP
jgi:hypothetical protein